jgi:peroxiredoxin
VITQDFADSLQLGQAAPGFALPATDGRTVSLDQFAGRPLVVFFTCNHCPYVVGWEARTQELATRFAALVPFVGINANDAGKYPDDDFAHMLERAQKGLPYAYLHDKTQEVARSYGAKVTPDYFLFDAQHRLAYRGRLDASPKDPSAAGTPFLANAIQAVLAGRTPEPATTPVEGCSVKWYV